MATLIPTPLYLMILLIVRQQLFLLKGLQGIYQLAHHGMVIDIHLMILNILVIGINNNYSSALSLFLLSETTSTKIATNRFNTIIDENTTKLMKYIQEVG